MTGIGWWFWVAMVLMLLMLVLTNMRIDALKRMMDFRREEDGK